MLAKRTSIETHDVPLLSCTENREQETLHRVAGHFPLLGFNSAGKAVAGGMRGRLLSHAQSLSLPQSPLAPPVGQRQAIFGEQAF